MDEVHKPEKSKKKILSLEIGERYFDVPSALMRNGIDPSTMEIITAALYTGEKDKPAAKEFLAYLIKKTSKTNFDLIILQEIQGRGLQSAEAIVGPSRANTVVMYDWHPIDPSIERQYREKGYKIFMSKTELQENLPKLLGFV